MSKVREITWPEEFVELKRIEESMVCGICYEYIDTTVMTPCSHNYCSLCIRKYLHYKSQCPACFHVFFEKDLYINRTMDVLIQHYIKVREKLISLIENRVVYNTVIQQREETPCTPPVRPVRNNQFPKSPKLQEIKEIEVKTPIYSPTSNILNGDTSSPTTHRSPKVIPSIAKIFNTPKRKETVIQSTTVAVKFVSCPVCSVDISEHHINVHLDACLKREVSQKVAKEKQKPKRQPLPKLVLRVMKDAELRKKMKEFGLPTNGDRRALEYRFTRYSTIYNAECDKLEPRAVPDLIRQCEMEEKQERKMDLFLVPSTSASTSTSTSTTVRLQIEKDAKEEKIEEAQKTYRIANKSSFDKLVEEVRNRRKMEQTNQSEEVTETNHEFATPVSHMSNTEKNMITKENLSVNPLAEIVFHDSDSDESCPLQHYRSDDPMQFLSLNLNNSSPLASTSGSPVKKFDNAQSNRSYKNNEIKSQNTSYDIYEASTDEFTDNEIQNSPVISRKLNRKKVKLSKISPKQLLPVESQIVRSESNDSIEKETRARDLCNSIIEDFSFEGMSDDGELSNKLGKDEIEKGNLDGNALKKVHKTSFPSRNKKTKDSCDRPILEDAIKRVILGDFSSNDADESCNNWSANFGSKIVNGLTVDSNDIKDKKDIKSIKCNIPLENTETEKENDVSSANENSQISTNETTIRRPVRKRNRPSRYTENQSNKPSDDESVLNPLTADLLENVSLDNFKAVSTSDGSLKRRRGRSRANVTSLSADEPQNPPKRPVRRRQVVTDNN